MSTNDSFTVKPGHIAAIAGRLIGIVAGVCESSLLIASIFLVRWKHSHQVRVERIREGMYEMVM